MDAFGQNALTFIGAGTNATNRAFYFYGEGGTTFNGPVNVDGTLKINGSAGTAGQVLTSNGVSDPTWQNSAFANNTRFAFFISRSASGPSGYALIGATQYNLNTSNVTINANNISINKTGLYHFTINMNSNISYSGAPSIYPHHELTLYCSLPFGFQILNKRMEANSTSNINWEKSDDLSVYFHITAPATVSFYHVLGESGAGTVTGSGLAGYVAGYLVSE